MPSYAVAYNTADTPVTIDADGRSIGGREFGAVDMTAEEVRRAGEAGRLHVFPELDVDPGQSEAAIEAVRVVSALRERVARLEGAPDDQLAGLARAHGHAAGLPAPGEAQAPLEPALRSRILDRLARDESVDAPALERVVEHPLAGHQRARKEAAEEAAAERRRAEEAVERERAAAAEEQDRAAQAQRERQAGEAAGRKER